MDKSTPRPRGGRRLSFVTLVVVLSAVLLGTWPGTARAGELGTPRTLAMGGAGRASATGAGGIFMNPAGIAMIKAYAIEAFYDVHVRKNGHIAHSSVVDSVASRYVAAGIYYTLTIFRPDLYERSQQKRIKLKVDGHETGLVLAVPLGSRFAIGTTIKYQNLKATAEIEVPGEDDLVTREIDKINNIGMDIGIGIRIAKGFTVGITAMNVIPQKSQYAPMQLGVGVAYSYKNVIMGAFDALLDFTTGGDPKKPLVDFFGGLEGFVARKYAIRAGVMHLGLTKGTHVTAGFGYVNPKAAVDVFIVQQVDRGIETRFGIAVKVFVK